MLLIDQLDLQIASDERGVFTLDIPEEQQESLGRGPQIEFTFDRARIDRGDSSIELVTPDGQLLNWLLAQLDELDRPLYAVPHGQTTQVHELSDRLFAAYQIDDGQTQLAGCAMEDRLFARLTFRRHAASQNTSDRLIEAFVDADGNPVDAATIAALGLDNVDGLAKPPELIAAERLSQFAESGKRQVDDTSELIATTLVWCKYCRGKLRFTIGDATAELPFEGWAETLTAPPFVCSETGKESFHVVATNDDRVTVAEAVETCAASGANVLGDMLEVCTVSGKRALPEHLIDCPVTHSRLMRTELTICPACSQTVSPRCIANDQCQACWPMPAVSKDDPRMARILDEHPGLDRWRNWHLRETDGWYLLEARGLVRRLLVAIAIETLEPLHLASGNRFGRSWTPIERARYEEFLR